MKQERKTSKEQIVELLKNNDPFSIAMEISELTNYRTSLLEELTHEEEQKLIAIYNVKLICIERDFNALKYDIACRRYKTNILRIAEQQGIKEKGCYDMFNHFMLHKSVFKKHLNAYDLDELKVLLRQMYALVDTNKQSAEKPLTKAWYRKGSKLTNMN